MNIPETAIEAAAIALNNERRGRVSLDPLDGFPWSSSADESREDAKVADESREDAKVAIEAALPHIVESFNQLVDQAVFKVDGVHHFHGSHCLCGEPASARARSQTEHITSAVVTELAARIAEKGNPK